MYTSPGTHSPWVVEDLVLILVVDNLSRRQLEAAGGLLHNRLQEWLESGEDEN